MKRRAVGFQGPSAADPTPSESLCACICVCVRVRAASTTPHIQVDPLMCARGQDVLLCDCLGTRPCSH